MTITESIKERWAQDFPHLDDDTVSQIAELLTLLLYGRRRLIGAGPDSPAIEALHAEAAEKDQMLAEVGMLDCTVGLGAEDKT